MPNDPMTAKDNAEPASHVRVWDFPTRLFHWTIVLLVFVSWFSADRGLMTIHLWSGLSLLALLLFRVAWGVVGSTTARFSDFLHPPRRIAGYLKGLSRGERLLHAGHNPAGGVMVAAMIAVLLAQAATGLFSNDGLRFNGPLAIWISGDISDQLTRIHGTIFNIILLLVWIHVVAIGFYAFVRGDNLVGPMLSGKKPRSHVPAGLNIVFTRTYIALLLLALTAGMVAWIVN
jgi:cytochrome b